MEVLTEMILSIITLFKGSLLPVWGVIMALIGEKIPGIINAIIKHVLH